LRDARTFRSACAFLLTAALQLLVLPLLTKPVSAASLRSDGLLEVDGQPFFPVGLVSNGVKVYPDDWHSRIRESGANFVWDIEIAYADTAMGCAALVDSAAAAGYRLMIGSGDTWNWDDLSTPELEVDQLLYEIDDLPGLAQCRDGRPGTVVAWANRDEPSWTISRHIVGDIDSTHVLWTHGQLKEFDPNAVVAMNFAPAHLSEDLDRWKSDITGYLPATDVVMFACYPWPAGPGTCTSRNVIGYPECTMDRLCIGADIFLTELNLPGQPLWTIVQAFKDVPYRQMKWEAAASIVHGATGVLWGGWTWWHPLGNGVDNWPVTVQVMNEVAGLHDWLVGPDRPVTSNQPDVEVRAKKGPNRTVLLIAISRNGYAGPAELRVPGTRDGFATVIGENRTVSVDRGRITDDFADYEAHFYAIGFSVGGEERREPAVDAPAQPPTAGPFRARAYPNPSGGPTVVEFDLPQAASVIFTVYDAAGRRVALAGRGSFEAGAGSVVWNGRNFAGDPVSPGVYFVRGKSSAGETATARVLIAR